MLFQKRGFHAAKAVFARAKPLRFDSIQNIKLREPIVPSHTNFDVSPDHPLWAFFPEGSKSKTCLRKPEELPDDAREWTMPELRRKSFEDLHKIWWLTLRERNVLLREIRLASSIDYSYTQAHEDLDKKLLLTQKRIKQTLLERQVAYERVQLFTEEQTKYLQEFEESYLTADDADVGLLDLKLIRLQYALFGIEPSLEHYDLERDITVKFIEGLEYVANLKAKRYHKANPSSFDLPLNGPVEQLPFLLRDVEQAVEEVKALRESGQNFKLDKIDMIPFLKNALASAIEAEASKSLEDSE